MKRFKTKYPGIFYREAERIGGPGTEKIYYALFKKDGKFIEAKCGRQYVDDMTPAKAARIRAELIEGKRFTPKEQREKLLIKTGGRLVVYLPPIWKHDMRVRGKKPISTDIKNISKLS